MRDSLPVPIFLLVLSAIEMSQATTTGFRRCFPEWINASQVKVGCKKENDANATQIAQYCDGQIQVCRKMNKPEVSLEKEQDGLCLAITNDSYDSWYCEAEAYIDDQEQTDNFTADFSNHLTNTSPSPGATDTSSSSNQWPYAIAVGIVVLIIIGLYKIYKKVSSRNTTGHLNRTNACEELGENEALREIEELGENRHWHWDRMEDRTERGI